jgi:hypothetical protein
MRTIRVILSVAVVMGVLVGFVPAYGASPCECDLNHDGRCDMRDWLVFGQDWGHTDCLTPGVNCECDLNTDGRCDMRDWLLFGKNWGRTDCPTVVPPSNLICFFQGDPDRGDGINIIGTVVDGAISYKLYMSTDGGNTYQYLSDKTAGILGNAFVFSFDVHQNSYFKVSAVTNQGESPLSNAVHLDYDNRLSMPTFNLISPANDATNVSLTPTFAWEASPAPSTVAYLFGVEADNSDKPDIIMTCSTNIWTYGTTNNVLVSYVNSQSPLKYNTLYKFSVWAIDSTGSMVALQVRYVKVGKFTTIPNP